MEIIESISEQYRNASIEVLPRRMSTCQCQAPRFPAALTTAGRNLTCDFVQLSPRTLLQSQFLKLAETVETFLCLDSAICEPSR